MRVLALFAVSAITLAQAADREISSEADVDALAFSKDGGTLAGLCRDGKVRLWDSKSGALKKSVAPDKSDSLPSLASEADVMAAVAKDGAIKIWDLQSDRVVRQIARGMPKAEAIAFSNDRKLVASSSLVDHSSDNMVFAWDSSGKKRFSVNAGVGGTSTMTFSPDAQILVAATWDADLRVWSTKNGELVRWINELPVSMFAVEFSPDGKTLATAGVDRTVYLWDAKTWKLLRKLVGQPEMIGAMNFSPDGKYLATGGFDSDTLRNPVKILLWDIAAGTVVRTIPAEHAVRSVKFSPDSKLIAVAAKDKAVQIWSVTGH
jgi:WD40 repeat protein